MSTTNILDLNNRIDALEKIVHDVEPIQQQIDELKAWTDSGTKDASGNPIILTDGAAFNAEGLVVTLEPKQNLHGYDHPWAGGAGKNKLPMTLADIKTANTSGTWSGNTLTIADMTVEIQTDVDNNVTGVLLKGTPSSTALFYFSKAFDSAVNVGNLLSGYPSGYTGSSSSAMFRFYTDDNTGDFNITTDDGAIQNIGTCNFIIRINSGYAIPSSGLLFKPMIRISTASSGFEPYTNECPITGYTECVVTVKDEEEATQDNATIAFGQTVYGGSVDFKIGKVSVEWASENISDLSWTFNVSNNQFVSTNIKSLIKLSTKAILCSCYKKYSSGDTDKYIFVGSDGTVYIKDTDFTNAEDFITAMAGQTICYELATPIELTLTPAELELLKGYNYITSNGNNIELTYQPDNLKADILLTVSQLYGSKISIFDGILTGGDTGQVLTKTSDDNYDATWAALPATRTTTKKSEK